MQGPFNPQGFGNLAIQTGKIGVILKNTHTGGVEADSGYYRLRNQEYIKRGRESIEPHIEYV